MVSSNPVSRSTLKKLLHRRHQDGIYLHARVPRVKCPEHGVHQVPVPWAREGSKFTLLYEALIMTLVREMPVLTAARMVGETDKLLWRVIDHYVPEARAAVDMANVHAVGVDETSSRRGHDYITLFVDLNARRLLFATPGKDGKTFEKFSEDLQAHGGSAEAITDVSMDLSPAFQGTRRNCRCSHWAMSPAVTGVATRQAVMAVMGKSSATVSARSCTMDSPKNKRNWRTK